jgi:phosphoribosylformylglycinamidine synthase
MIAKPRVVVFTGEGLNTDEEMKLAFELAGAEARGVHVRDLLTGCKKLDSYQIAAIPGGFLHGDDIAAARVLANQLRTRMRDELEEYISKDRLVMGVCNGFQALVKSGILPYADFKQHVTLTHNDSGRFEDRWVELHINPVSPCVFTKSVEKMYLPIRHGEGRFYADRSTIQEITGEHLVTMHYWDDGDIALAYPANPNGSVNAIAGICDTSGRVFGMMPHPEAYINPYQHPRWTRLKYDSKLPEEGDGMKIFRNAVEYFR